MGFRDAFLVATRGPAARGPMAPPIPALSASGPAIAAAPAALPSAVAAPSASEGVFLSTKSLMSFPIASGAVTIVWKLLQHFWNVGDIAVLYIALLVGAVLFLIVISDSGARPKGIVGWVISVLIAVLNSLLLAASALGLAKDVLGNIQQS